MVGETAVDAVGSAAVWGNWCEALRSIWFCREWVS